MARPTKEQIRELPLYLGLDMEHIHIVDTQEQAQLALVTLQHEHSLGFDTESKPIFRKGQVCPGPTLIQLANATDAFLFPTRFAFAVDAASQLLNNPNIKKVGFGLAGDKKELSTKLDIHIQNIEDLAVTVKHLAGEKKPLGARASVAFVLKQRLGKGAQKSNWGTYPLSPTQIQYAANDAYCAICIENVIHTL
ncbi:3'-5' exonuclease [Marinicellulosiphila megalodicopiae]|uniref:3'-5' exonuclease n=1 Tax=Marinicellulosiphila megalodicopiae TaxID=2724896 RepID=UPI003BAF018E